MFRTIWWWGICACLTLTSCDNPEQPEISPGLRIDLTFNGPVYQGSFYSGYLPRTDYGIWIEDTAGTLVKTLRLTPTVLKVDTAHGSHLTHLPAWTTSSGVAYADLEAAASHGAIPAEYDAVTAASPVFGPSADDTTVSVTWDLTDAEGNPVDEGTYRFCAEVANIAKDSVGDNPYPSDSIMAQSSRGTVEIGSGTVVDGERTVCILGLSAAFVE